MINAQQLQGHWNEVRGKIRRKWGQLSNDDLAEFRGNVEELVGVIQRKTGVARGQVESYLTSLSEEYSNGGLQAATATAVKAAETARDYVGHTAEVAREYVGHTAEAAHEMMDQFSGQMREGYVHAEDMVKRHPAESIAVAFGAGLLTGVILSMCMRTSR